jgi:hypothetical protein
MLTNLKTNKQKLLALASGQVESRFGGGGRFNDPGPQPKYPQHCPGIQQQPKQDIYFSI